MAHFYFDIETYSPGQFPDPSVDKIISIQYQQLDPETGTAKGELQVLREWESNEREILIQLGKELSPWNFIPVGNGLDFERRFLRARGKLHDVASITQHGDFMNFPLIDLRSIFVILNKGNFRGSGMHNFTSKKQPGNKIAEWYAAKDYAAIDEYIENETQGFVEFYQKCCERLPVLLVP